MTVGKFKAVGRLAMRCIVVNGKILHFWCENPPQISRLKKTFCLIRLVSNPQPDRRLLPLPPFPSPLPFPSHLPATQPAEDSDRRKGVASH